MRTTIKRMIRQYGVDLPHKKYVKVITDGEEDISYETQEPKRGQINEISPYYEVRNIWGTVIDADYIITFLPEVVIATKDQLYINGAWCTVETYILHKTGNFADYIEIFVKKAP